jgi:hypothetical protein
VSRTNPKFPVRTSDAALDIDPATRARTVRALARFLDNSISIPGTDWRFGFDAVVGLVPVVGDLIGGSLSAYILLEAARAEVPILTLARMLAKCWYRYPRGFGSGAWRRVRCSVEVEHEERCSARASFSGERATNAREAQCNWVSCSRDDCAGADRRRRIRNEHIRGSIALGALDPIALSYGAVAKW